MNRRSFIKKSSLASVAVLAGCDKDKQGPWFGGNNIRRKAIVIGSGFGGAIAALRLCEAGIETTILERGMEWDSSDPFNNTFADALGSDNRSTWLSRTSAFPFGPPLTFPIKFTGVLEKVRMAGIDIMAPAAWGGGSITFGGILATPIREAFEDRFPASVDYDELTALHFPKVIQELGASVMPDDIFNHPGYNHNRLFKQHNDNAGITTTDIISNYDWDIIRKEIEGIIPSSSLNGEAIFGCNSGAKNSLDKNYLKKAAATGFLEKRQMTVVTGISSDEKGLYYVQADVINTNGVVVDRVNYTCDYLFMAAGSVGTSRLMVRARARGDLARLNDEVGKGWGNNGMSMLIRGNISAPTGARQAFPPRYGALSPSGSAELFFVEHFPFSLGGNIDLKMLGYNMMGIPQVRGSWEYNSINDSAELNYPLPHASDQKNLDAEAVAFCNDLNDANGGDLSNFLGKVPVNNVTYHPLGGMVMERACDTYGRVANYNNLYIMDGSLLPGTSGCCNPALTIAGLAERNMEHILNNDF